MSFRINYLVLALAIAFAASAGAASKPAAAAVPPPRPKPEWNVCTEVLMVAMPLEKMLPLLPDLRNPAKAEGAVAQLLAAIQRKEALLTGYPVAYSDDGQRGVSEAYLEKRYATEYRAPSLNPKEFQAAPPGFPKSFSFANERNALPTSFETRNVGVTLEAECEVRTRGKSIHLNIVPRRTELLGFESFQAAITQPQFTVSTDTTSLTVPSGQYTLIGVHLIPKPENYMEVFILRATAVNIPVGERGAATHPLSSQKLEGARAVAAQTGRQR